VQQKPDGSFPQNSWLDGRPFWGSLQMDEVAYPLILAYQLGRTDNATWTKHVKTAADFLIARGPRTDQERWEEKPGYSPSTIAAEIAGLVCAAEIARRNSDEASAGIYLAAADDWARNVERWTATTTGVYGDKNYYLRITENDDPNDGAAFNVGNGGGTFDERKIVDAGFLELVRLGIKRADDPLIAKSLKVVDEVIRVRTPNGDAWYRYNNDGYGEMDDGRPWNFDGKYTGKGRLWALLSGERGQYEIARDEKTAARGRLDAMMGMANEGLMIPEQVWDKPVSPTRPRFEFGEGTGSATPLAWSMAQFIRLATNLAENRNMDTPDIVRKRYVEQTPPAQAAYDIGEGFSEVALQRLTATERSQPLRFTFRAAAGARLFAMANGETREIPLNKNGEGELRLERLTGDTLVFALQSPTGATAFTRFNVRPANATTDAPDKMNKVMEQLKSATTSPVIIEDTAYFIYRGAARDVQLAGDMTGWRPRGLRFAGIDGTNMKFYAQTFAKDARVEYKLIADGEWINDPLNEDKIDNGVGGENSVFAMPNYRGAFIKGVSEWSQRVRISSFIPAEEEINVPSRILGGTRRVKVWSDSWQRGKSDAPLPVLYLQDGSDYLLRTLAHFAAKRGADGERVKPFIIVAVDPADRMKEYWANDRFADFMATELVPYIDKNYRTIPTRDARALMGASLGGVISVWTALRHPDVFGRVGGQSTAFWIDDERVVSALNRLPVADPRKPVHFYFDVGRMESILDVNRRVQTSLRAKGYAVTYREAETGHNWTSWRDRLADAYIGIWKD
jgi:enterochelin esterase-like enzyme